MISWLISTLKRLDQNTLDGVLYIMKALMKAQMQYNKVPKNHHVREVYQALSRINMKALMKAQMQDNKGSKNHHARKGYEPLSYFQLSFLVHAFYLIAFPIKRFNQHWPAHEYINPQGWQTALLIFNYMMV